MRLVVDLEDAVHALEIDDDTTGVRGRCTAIAEVPARRDGPQWDAIAVGDSDDGLHLLDGIGRDGRGRNTIVGFAFER
jgi:hypothetical protein